MEWQDFQLAEIISRNVRALGVDAGYTNLNQLAKAMREWAVDQQYIEAPTINTLRNMSKAKHGPNMATMAVIAECLRVPAYALLIPDGRLSRELVSSINALVATYVNAEPEQQTAIKQLVGALATSKVPQAAND